jgi:hypothetical protein
MRGDGIAGVVLISLFHISYRRFSKFVQFSDMHLIWNGIMERWKEYTYILATAWIYVGHVRHCRSWFACGVGAEERVRLAGRPCNRVRPPHAINTATATCNLAT